MNRFFLRIGFAWMCSVSFTANSQENMPQQSLPVSRYEIGVYNGVSLSRDILFTAAEWTALTPGYANGGTVFNGMNYLLFSQTEYGIRAGVALRSEWLKGHHITPMLTVGLTHAGSIDYGVSWGDSQSFTTDTLISSQTGLPVYYIDSFHSESLYKRMNADRWSLSGRYMLQGNRQGRFSWLAGIELNAGMALTHEFVVDSVYRSALSIVPAANVYSYQNPYSSMDVRTNELKRSKTGNIFYYGFGIPIGLDFRLGKHDNWLGRTILGAEFMTGIRWTKVQDFTAKRTPFFNGGLQLKYRI